MSTMRGRSPAPRKSVRGAGVARGATPAVALALAVASAPVPAAGPKAEIRCAAIDPGLQYDCVVDLSRDGKPLEGASLSVSADMPSMPMAHNVEPVAAVPGDRPGRYRVRLQLEMTGEWAVKLRLRQPVRDLVIVHRQFDESGTLAPGARR